MRGKHEAQKITTSKIILYLDFAVALILGAIVVNGAYLGRDMSHVTQIALAWDAQLAVAVGCYYWKAKNENRSRHAMKLVRELAGEYGIDAAARFAEIVLKD